MDLVVDSLLTAQQQPPLYKYHSIDTGNKYRKPHLTLFFMSYPSTYTILLLETLHQVILSFILNYTIVYKV